MSLTPHLIALAGVVSSASATILIRQGLRHDNFYAGFWINIVVGVGLCGAVVLLEPADAYRPAAIPFFMLSGIIGTVSGRLSGVVVRWRSSVSSGSAKQDPCSARL